jgi:AcrR family transcriptional regulator
MPKHFSDEERKTIRNQLMDKAQHLFETEGLKHTKIENLAKSIGISKGSFYSFFNSKGDLYMQVYQRARNIAHEQCKQMFDRPHYTVDEVAASVGGYERTMRLLISQRPILDIMYNLYGLDLIYEDKARESLLNYNNEINAKMSQMIQDWMDKTGVYSVSGRIIAEMLRSLDFLRWHDYAIGYDIFNEVIEKFIEAIEGLLRASQLSDEPVLK